MIEDSKKLFYNYMHIILGVGVARGVFQLVAVVLLTRMLGAEGFGSYALFISVSLVTSMLTMWTAGSIIRYGRQEMIEEGSVRKTFWANYWMLLPFFSLTFLVVFFYQNTLGGYIGTVPNHAWLICAYILLNNLSLNIPVAFQAVGKMSHFAYLPLVGSGFFVIALIVVTVGQYMVSVDLFLRLFIGGLLLGIIVGLVLLRRYITPICFPWGQIKRCFKYSWSMMFGGASEQLITNIDQIVIRMFMALAFVGIYNVAYLLQNYVVMLPLMSVGLIFPMMVSWFVTGKESRIREYMRSYVPQIVFVWALMVSVVLLFAPEIFLVFGEAYSMAVLPFSLLLVGVAFRIFAITASPVLSTYKLVKETVVVGLLIGVVNLGLDLLLIPMIGIVGAAVATTVAFVIGAIAGTAIMRRKVGIDNFSLYPWLFPVAFGCIGLLFADILLVRVVLVLVVVFGSLWVAKTRSLFTMESLHALETIQMPSFLHKLIRKGYTLMS